MKNPISMKTRGQLYVTSIILSGSALVVTAVLTLLGLPEWLAVVTATVSAVSMVASALARDNLALPGDATIPQEHPDANAVAVPADATVTTSPH